MAHHVRLSCVLDVRTAANVERAFTVYTDLLAENAQQDPPADAFRLSVVPDFGAHRLWLHDTGTADQQLLIAFVQRCATALGLTGRWGFQWAQQSDPPSADGFGGGAHVLDLATGRTIDHISTSRWLDEHLTGDV